MDIGSRLLSRSLSNGSARINAEFDRIRIAPFPFLLFVALGWSPWLLVNAIYLELSIFFVETPETFKIASSISLSIQCANIFLVLYLALRHYLPWIQTVPFLYLSILVAMTSAVVIALFWEVTAAIGGDQVSVVIIAVSFFAGGVGCISNATFWPFVSSYHPTLLMSLSLGMGMSGILPSIIVAIQEAGEIRRFSVTVYFFLTAILLVASLASLILIRLLPSVNHYHRESHLIKEKKKSTRAASNASSTLVSSNILSELSQGDLGGAAGDAGEREALADDPSMKRPLIDRSSEPLSYGFPTNVVEDENAAATTTTTTTTLNDEPATEILRVSYRRMAPMFMGMFWIALVNFFLPGVTTYLVAAFPDSAKVLLWFNVVGMVGGTVGRFVSVYFRRVSFFTNALALTLLFSLLFVFGNPGGFSSWALVLIHLPFSFIFGLTYTMFYKMVATHNDVRTAELLCKWLGACEQAGAFTGSLFSFLLVYFEFLDA